MPRTVSGHQLAAWSSQSIRSRILCVFDARLYLSSRDYVSYGNQNYIEYTIRWSYAVTSMKLQITDRQRSLERDFNENIWVGKVASVAMLYGDSWSSGDAYGLFRGYIHDVKLAREKIDISLSSANPRKSPYFIANASAGFPNLPPIGTKIITPNGESVLG